MKILVPVDFYEASFSAYKYASQVAEILDAEITLLHVINGMFSTSEVIAYDPYLGMEDASLKRMDHFAKDYAEEQGIKLPRIAAEKVVRFGVPGFAIAQYAGAHEIDLIIMGTRDKHGIFDRLLGSASAVAIKESDCPVMLIHEQTKFNIPKKIVFAFDNKTDLEESVEDFKKFNDIIKAKTDFLHINTKGVDDLAAQKKSIVEELFEDNDPKFAFEIKELGGNQVMSALNDYCLFEKIDIVAMIHRKEGVFSNLFRTSQSIKVAQKFHLPVLVFQED